MKRLAKRLIEPLRKAGAGTGDQDEPPNGVSREMFPTGIKPLYTPEDSTIDIVFVHGLTGSRTNTWTARNETEPWPKTLLPSVLTTARVLTFGYDASVADWRGVVSQNRVGNHAWNLLTSLASYRENDDTNERPIIFVCHSLGGLVCEDSLVTSRQRRERHLQNILHSTHGIIFLGTPHHGSGLARWAEALSQSIGLIKQTNSKIVEVLTRDSEVLARIQDNFHTMVMARSKDGLPPIEISCFYEELPLPKIGLVVPQHSAILPGYIPIGIHANHMDMTKFTKTDDPGFTAICGELRRWIKNMGAADGRHDKSAKSPLGLLSNSNMEEQPSVANRSGGRNRMFNDSGGSQKNIYGDNYESGGGVMNIGTHQHFHAEVNDPQVHRIIPLPPNGNVVSRDEIFARLDHLLPPTSEYQSAALFGLGGSGKTQVALEYTYRRCREDLTCSVFWVHADNETTFAQDYKIIGRKLGLGKHDGRELLTTVRERIESGPSWLLVLDNADDPTLFGVGRTGEQSTSLYDYVPKSGAGTVLWTSRDERIVGLLVGPERGIRVGDMSLCQARRLLETSRDKYIWDEEVDDVQNLIRELHCLPLAISQAGAYLRRTSMSIGEYLSKLKGRRQRWRVLKEAEFDRYRLHNVPNSVLETWSRSIERIRRDNEMAYKVLHIIAYVDSRDIPFELMKAAGLYNDKEEKAEEVDEVDEEEAKENEDQVLEAVTRLKEFSFLEVCSERKAERSYEMHRLVQEATRYGLSVSAKPEDEIYFSTAALRVITRLFPGLERQQELEEARTNSKCDKYIAHAVRVGEWAEICKRRLEVSDLLHRVSCYLFARSLWREQEPVDVRVYELRRGVLGERHPDTLEAMQRLAETYRRFGRYADAERMGIKVLEMRREVLGERHPSIVMVMLNLAKIYQLQDRGIEAEGVAIEALELQRVISDERHQDTLHAMGTLGVVYFKQGRYIEAERIGIKVLKLQREALGESHASNAILSAMLNLAATYTAQRRYTEAESLQNEVLGLQRVRLGEKHPETLLTIYSLATTYFEQGRYTEAEPMLINVVQLRREVLGAWHPHTLWAMKSLAFVLWNKGGQRREAISLLHECRQLGSILFAPEDRRIKSINKTLEDWKYQQAT